jgi:hypothetical protein
MNVGIKCWDDSQVELFYSTFNGIGQGLTSLKATDLVYFIS